MKKKDTGEEKKKKRLIDRINETVKQVIHFLTYEIWRISAHELSKPMRFFISMMKTIILAIRGFNSEQLQTKASALTYRTLLAIVPLLAVILGVAQGFRIQDNVREELLKYFPGRELELNKAISFVESYLSQAQGGVILGVGLVFLFYTVINLISSIEVTFNDIWQIQKNRPWKRKIIDYMALFLILPLLMTLSSGISVFLTTIQNSFLNQYVFLAPVVDTILKIAPFVIVTMSFTAIYILLPNTKVHFFNGLIGGFIAGCAFQFFQFLFISGQIWVSKYNAIYGSFAAIPLLLLWMQLSWLICLFGAELAYASQNVKKFSFERDSTNISRRYKDFLTLLIATLIVKRFVKGRAPYTADELSDTYRIPLRITTQILYFLTEIKIIIEVNYGDDDRVVYYQPAIDVNKISVGYLFDKIDRHGSENFKVDTSCLFGKEWEAILKTRKDMMTANNEIYLKDL